MKFTIQDTTKAQQYIELFKIIKHLNSYTTICSQNDKLFIQIMDESHVCLFNASLENSWFETYESNGETFSFMSTIMVKILQLYVANATISFQTNDEKLAITFEYEDKTEKIFELNLIDIDKELLDSQHIEGSVEFEMSTKVFDKYISEMMLFGDSAEIICHQDNLYLKSSGDQGKYTLKLPYSMLNELQIEEGLQLKTRISLKYISYITRSHGVFKNIKFHIEKDVPLFLEIKEPGFELHYYIAPKINDDEQDEHEDYSEFETDDYTQLENKVL